MLAASADLAESTARQNLHDEFQARCAGRLLPVASRASVLGELARFDFSWIIPRDGHDVPVLHFNVMLELPACHALAARLHAAGNWFVVDPHVRFDGPPGVQATLVLLDPSGNALESKGFADIMAQLFAT